MDNVKPSANNPMTAFVPPFRVIVELTPHLWPQGYEYALDGPADGSIAEAFSVELGGFILRPREQRHLSRPEALRFRVLGSVIWRCPVDLPRPDLLQSNRLRNMIDERDIYCGFNTILPAFLAPAATPIEILVSLGQGDEEKSEFCFGFISFTPTGAQVEKFNSISVVNINSIGRSGSSLLCKILDSHPAFVVPKLFGQYGEVSIINHYLRAISVMCSSGAASHLNGFESYADFLALPAGYLNLDLGSASNTDLTSSLMRITRESMLGMFKSVLDEVAKSAHQSKPQCMFWVEKTWNYLSSHIGPGLIGNMREILLVRSIQGFWKSQYAFQRKMLIADRDIKSHFSGTFDKYLNIISRYEASRDYVCLVKYEDLLKDPVEVFTRIFHFLGVEFEPSFADTVLAIVNGNDEHARYMKSDDQGIPEEFDLGRHVATLSAPRRDFIERKLSVLGYSL
jgi:Sulfotransferase domain